MPRRGVAAGPIRARPAQGYVPEVAEAGCLEEQIKAISGHTTSREVSRYTKAADQRRMAIDAMETIQRTKLPNPTEGLGKSKRK